MLRRTGIHDLKLSNWLRRDLPSADVVEVLARYPVCHFCEPGFPRVANLQNHGGYSGARIFRVTGPKHEWALREWPVSGIPIERLSGLHRLLRFLACEGVPCIAVPEQAATGESWVQFEGRFWQLEPWLPGEASFHQSPTGEKLANAMHMLARWHEAARRYQPLTEHSTWFRQSKAEVSPNILERLRIAETAQRVLTTQGSQTLSNRMPPSLLPWISEIQHLLPGLIGQLRTASTWRVALQPVLRDLWHDHVLFAGNQVTGIIDPAGCRTDNVTADLARLLGSLVEDDRMAWMAALNCNEENHPLMETEQKLIRLFDLSNVVLGAWYWIQRVHEMGDEEFGQRDAKLVERWNRLGRRLAFFAQREGKS